MQTILISLALIALVVVGAVEAAESQPPKQAIRFEINDAQGQPLPCRVYCQDATGRPPVTPAGYPFWLDHFSCDGRAVLPAAPGRYQYQVERGPEYAPVSGTLELVESQDQTVTVKLDRIADLAKDGWFSGDLHVHRPLKDMPLLMQASDLHVGPAITWWNRSSDWRGRDIPGTLLHSLEGQRFYHTMGGEDERDGGALLYFGLQRPLSIAAATHDCPSPVKYMQDARKASPDVWIDIEKPFWWDVPVWLASGLADSIGLANNHMQRRGMLANEAWGRPRDKSRLPDPLGNGIWSQEIYYHILDCGLRLPPSAGGASGVLGNPVGYNRVYVHVDGKLDYDQWWRQLKAGRCFVTNGPLLCGKAQDQLPGHVFAVDAGKRLDISMDISLVSNDRVPRIEIIKNGHVDSAVETDDAVSQQRSAKISFTESGWFLVRAITDNKKTFRFASTGPFYVEVGPQKQRISRPSAQFFLDWVLERQKQIQAKVLPPEELRELLAAHASARQYWEGLLKKANAD